MSGPAQPADPLRQTIARLEIAQRDGYNHEAVVLYRRVQIVEGEARLTKYVVTRQYAMTPGAGEALRWYDSGGHYYHAAEPNAYARALAMYQSVAEDLLRAVAHEATLDHVRAYVEEP